MNDASDQLPFHATESEKRIIREHWQIAKRRSVKPPATGGFTAAADYIAALKTELFPNKSRIATERARLLKPLQGDGARVHFDATLESAALTLQVKIRTAEEYAKLIGRLQAFDFEAWSRHCEGERADAD